MNKTMRNLLIGLTLLHTYCDGLVLPREVFTLLSGAIQSIPKINKGTDSRVGVGFRLGNHADFQTIFEIGPQIFTKPLVDNASANENIGGYEIIKRTVTRSQHIHNTTNEMKDKKLNLNAQKPRIAENDSLKSSFGLKDQYPIPTASPITD